VLDGTKFRLSAGATMPSFWIMPLANHLANSALVTVQVGLASAGSGFCALAAWLSTSNAKVVSSIAGKRCFMILP